MNSIQQQENTKIYYFQSAEYFVNWKKYIFSTMLEDIILIYTDLYEVIFSYNMLITVIKIITRPSRCLSKVRIVS